MAIPPEELLNRVPTPTNPRPRGQLAGAAMCLSGGGYRAMLFHVGALRRLNEVGYLRHIALFSSVSGGSITAAVLAIHWDALGFDANGVADNLDRVEKELFDFAGKWVDVNSVVGGALLPGRSIADSVTKKYNKHLFDDRTLQDLPDEPRFTINATNLQTGRLVRFTKEKLASYGVGELRKPTLDLASAVAASSAFPPVLSPKTIKIPQDAKWHNRGDWGDPPFTTKMVTGDGGIYDNLGLERAERYHTVLASDGGAPFKIKPSLKLDWALQSKRAWLTTDRQVRGLRTRNLVGEYQRQERLGAYWGIDTNIDKYKDRGLEEALPVSSDVTKDLARVKTKLRPVKKTLRYQLINWGYAVCDAAIRTDLDPSLAMPESLPYPKHPLS